MDEVRCNRHGKRGNAYNQFAALMTGNIKKSLFHSLGYKEEKGAFMKFSGLWGGKRAPFGFFLFSLLNEGYMPKRVPHIQLDGVWSVDIMPSGRQGTPIGCHVMLSDWLTRSQQESVSPRVGSLCQTLFCSMENPISHHLHENEVLPP